MLSFNGPDVFWQCAEAAVCEDFPCQRVERSWALSHLFWGLVDLCNLPNKVLVGEEENRLMNTKFLEDDRGSPRQRYIKRIQGRWLDTMTSYCKASLTYPEKDVFKALEGVGQRAAQLTGDVYQHGLLRRTLPQALLWDTEIKACDPSPTGRAPS